MILIEWIGAPIQDIAAYHVYRAEKLAGPYSWVGGMTVETPPKVPVELTSPFTPSPTAGCDEIPLDIRDDMSEGSVYDKSADPKIIYWYKVLGIDQVGNESVLDEAIPVSTFTYSTEQPNYPTITSVSAHSPECGLLVEWSPAFDSSEYLGFVVYRSENSTGPFLQTSSILAANEYLDMNVVRGVSYWYKVLRINKKGVLSPLSASQSGSVPN